MTSERTAHHEYHLSSYILVLFLLSLAMKSVVLISSPTFATKT